jgi:hypothetical protein
MARDMAGINEQRESDCTAKVIAILGNSHASRLGRALENLGLSVISLTDSSWKLTKASVEEAVTKLADLEPSPDIVIIQCLVNNTYFVAGNDCSLALPVRAKDGKYNVCGELRVATNDQAVRLLTTIEPLLKTLPDVPKIVLSPLPPYSLEGQSCCDRTDHMTNMGPDLAGSIRTGLANIKKTA